jgi:hypothetical protein
MDQPALDNINGITAFAFAIKKIKKGKEQGKGASRSTCIRHAEAVSLGNPGPGEAAARCLPSELLLCFDRTDLHCCRAREI